MVGRYDSHITCLALGKAGAGAPNGRKKRRPCGPTENLVKPMENKVSGQRGVGGRKYEPYG